MENHPSSWENQLYIAIFNSKLLTSPRRPQATAPGSLLTISKSLGRNPNMFHQFHRSRAPCKTCSKPPTRKPGFPGLAVRSFYPATTWAALGPRSCRCGPRARCAANARHGWSCELSNESVSRNYDIILAGWWFQTL